MLEAAILRNLDATVLGTQDIVHSQTLANKKKSSTSDEFLDESNSNCSANIPQAFCLRWNNYQSNLMSSFTQLLQDEKFVDVTLVGDGFSIKAHKIVLSACSPYFEKVFHENPCKHPIVILRDVRWSELKCVVEFMYKGEINVAQDEIEPLLRLAQVLKVRGLADVTTETKVHTDESTDKIVDNVNDTMPVKAKNSNHDHSGDMTNQQQSSSPKRSKLLNKDWDDCIMDFINGKGITKFKRETTTPSVDEIGTGMETSTMVHADDVSLSNFSSLINDSLSSATSVKAPPLDDSTNDLVIDETNTNTQKFDQQSWLNTASTSATTVKEFYDPDGPFKLLNNKKNYANFLKLKPPTWTQTQLHDAICAVVTQKLRFTQASVRYNIPKGTLYDNILGKSNRMQVLDEAGLDATDEKLILDFCCESSFPPYNRRTKKPLADIIAFVQNLCKSTNNPFKTNGKFCFRWWWAFCKKYSIVSLHYGMNTTKAAKQKDARKKITTKAR